MKKIVMVMLVAFAGAANAGLNIDWTGSSALSYLYDSSGAQLTGSGLLIQLVIDVGNNTDVSQMITDHQFGIGSETGLGGVDPSANASDDIVGTWNDNTWNFLSFYGADVAGTVASDVDPNNSRRFYFRWFNAASQGSATEVGLIFNSANAWVSPADSSAANAVGDISFGVDPNATGSTYNPGSNEGWATVAPVPEPASMALMGLGLAAVAVRRRFKKKV